MRLLLLSLLLLALIGCNRDTSGGDSPAPEGSEPAAVEPDVVGSTDEFQARDADFGPRDQMPGAALYAEHCAGCHNGTVPKAPHLHWLEMMSPHAVLNTMNEGIMTAQAAPLSQDERRHVAEYITMQRADGPAPEARHAQACSGEAADFDTSRPFPRVGWGHDTARFSPGEVAGLAAADVPRLELKWAYTYPGALRARSQPAVGLGAVYTGSQDGTVYAFDLETGCIRWTYEAAAEVRTGVVLASGDGSPPLAIFGDILAKLYAVDALTGEEVWSVKVDDHPSATLTATPAVADDRIFAPVSSLEVIAAADPSYECCTFRGKVLALELATGELIWEHFTIPDEPVEVGKTSAGTRILSPSGAPSWTSPAVDRKRNRIYVGTGENYSSPADENSDSIIAIDMTTGERAWQRQSTSGDAWNVACMMADNPNCPEENGPDYDHGASVILVDLPDGGQVLAVGHKNGTIFGLDPDADGKELWATRVGRGSIQGGVHFGMAASGAIVYAPINDMNNTYNGDDLDPDAARPGVFAIDAGSGEVLWEHVQENVCPSELQYCDPGISAPVSAIPGALFAGHLDGFVRAYAQDSGEVLWQYDTKTPVDAVNGLPATGGSMSGAGPAIVDGHLVINSGYGLYFHEPGNMLAVFSVEGR